MRRAEKEQSKSAVIRVHYFAGSYIADGGGKRATCKSCSIDAATELGRILFGKAYFTLTPTAEKNTWRAVAEVAR